MILWYICLFFCGVLRYSEPPMSPSSKNQEMYSTIAVYIIIPIYFLSILHVDNIDMAKQTIIKSPKACTKYVNSL